MHELQGDSYASKQALARLPPQLMSEFAHTTSRRPAYEGGLISYWASVKELLARGGDVVAKILRGAKPSEIPIEYSTRIRLVVNLRTAKAMGLTIPESVLIQADEVIR